MSYVSLLLLVLAQIGAHEDYTKSFETLFNQAASKADGAIPSGITFFDSDDDEPAAPAEETEEQRERQRKDENKRKKKEKKAKEAAAAEGKATDSDADEPKSKKLKRSPSPAAAPPAPIAPRTLHPSSVHYIRFSMGSKLLPDSHAEVDLSGKQVRKGGQASDDEGEGRAGLGAREEEEEPTEMRYISSSKPRPAASSIPKAKENHTIKHGAQVKEQNGHHLYHDRSQGKLKRLEEADRAFLEMIKAKQAGATPSPAASPTGKGALFSTPLFAAPSPSPSPTADSSPSPMDEGEEETDQQRKERKAAKKAKKEAKKEKRKD